MITKIFYSVSNGGDGSAYPWFFNSKECADFHQSLEEGWGEDCTGFIEIESDGPVKVKDSMTYEEYAEELKDSLDDYSDGSERKKSIEKFLIDYNILLRDNKLKSVIND
jgi:hypothetical protein